MHVTAAVCSLALGALLCAQVPVRITGLVVDGKGNALTGVGLAAGTLGQEDIMSLLRDPLAKTDGAGRLDARVVLTELSVLVIGKEGGACYWREVHDENFWPGRLDLGCITLPEGKTIRGLVRNVDGKPVVGARVDALDVLAAPHIVLSGSRFVSSVRTDAKGRFALRGIADSGAMVTVKKPGYYLARFPHVSPLEPLVVELRPGGSAAGKVLDEFGEPVAGSWIIVRYEHVEETRWRPIRDGTFRFDLDYPGRYCIWAFEQTWGRTSTGRSAVLSGTHEDVVIEINRKTRGRVKPLILGDDGKPLKEAEVAALWGSAISQSRPKPVPLFRTAADGRVSLLGPSGKEESEGMLFARTPGYAMHLGDYLFRGEKQPEHEPTIRLQPESSIRGKVVDADTGAAVAGARILAWHKNRKLAHIYFAMARRPFAVSNAKGEFRISELPAGDWLLQVMHPDRPHFHDRAVALRPAQHRRDIKLAMPRGHRVHGRVTGDVGRRAVQIGAYFQGRRTFRPYNSPTRVSIGLPTGGRFATHGLRGGRYEFHVSLPQPQLEGGRVTIPVLDRRLGQDCEVNLELTERNIGVVQGRVRIRGAAPPLHRLIVASEQERFARAVSMLAADGSYRFFGDGKPFRILIQDLSTGAVLYRSANVIERADTGPVTHNVDLHLAMVRLRIEARDKSTIPSRLKIDIAHPGFKKRLWFRPLQFPYAACPDGLLLRPGQVDVELYLPSIETTVQAFRGLLPKSRPLELRRVPTGKIVFEPVAGKINRYTLEIASDGRLP